MRTIAVFHIPCKKCRGEGKYPERINHCPYCRSSALSIIPDSQKYNCKDCHRIFLPLFLVCEQCKGSGFIPERPHW